MKPWTPFQKYGFQQTFLGSSGTAEDRFKILKSADGLFSFKKEQDAVAREYMKMSYERLKASMQSAYKAWRILDQSSQGSSDNFIDPRLVAPFNRIFNAAWPNMFGIVGMNMGSDLSFGEVQKERF